MGDKARIIAVAEAVRPLIVECVPSPNHGGPLVGPHDPTGIVIHYTGGPHGTTAKWFANPKAKASAHLIIQRDGKLILSVDLDWQAWHAGISALDGRKNCNQFTWGIELENWGPIVRRGDGYFVWPPMKDGVPQFERRFSGGAISHTPFDRRYEYWESYTDDQIETLTDVLREMVCPPGYNFAIPREKVVGHEHVAPERKIDPGPVFPWKRVLDSVYGREAPSEVTALADESDELFFEMMGAKPKDRG